MNPFHDPERAVPQGKVLSCRLCAPGVKGAPPNKPVSYLLNDAECAIHSARCTGKQSGDPQTARTIGHGIIQRALQAVFRLFFSREGAVTQIKPSPPMADHFAQAAHANAKGPSKAPLGIGASRQVREQQENAQEEEMVKQAGVFADLLVRTIFDTTLLDITLRSCELPRGNPCCRPPPVDQAVKPIISCNAANVPNAANKTARDQKLRLYNKKWNLDSKPGVKLVIAAFEHGGRWDEPLMEWFDNMFKIAVKDNAERAWCKSKAYQIVAVAVRKAVAGIHLASHRPRLSAYRIVDPPKELKYLLDPPPAAL